MTIVASAGVDDITSESDQRTIFSFKVEGYRRNFETTLNNAVRKLISACSDGRRRRWLRSQGRRLVLPKQSRDLPGKLKQKVRPCASFEDSFRVGNAKPTISLLFKSDVRDPFSGDLNRDGLFNWADHNCGAAFIPTVVRSS